jgi:protein TonB
MPWLCRARYLDSGSEPQTAKSVAMEAVREPVVLPRWSGTGRWAICLALALGIHAAAAAALLTRWGATPDEVANAPVIMIELATLPVSPVTEPSEMPPGPRQPQAVAEPDTPKVPEKAAEAPPNNSKSPNNSKTPTTPMTAAAVERVAELPPQPQAEPQPADIPPPKPVEKPVDKAVEKKVEKPVEKRLHRRHASLASAPSAAERRAERAAAPTPGAAAYDPDAVPNWKSQLVARLERYKRYPSQAQSRGEQGVTQLAFSVDRDGGVHHARVLRSSGSSLLDEATLALLERAAPLPPPPAELRGTQIAIVVPIRYSIH